MLKVLITGSNGFVGKNLINRLKYKNDVVIYEYDMVTSYQLLDEYCQDCNFIFNLAGVNRTQNKSDFMEGNYGFITTLLSCLKKHKNRCPIMLASSIQAELKNPYGESKKSGEEYLLRYGETYNAPIFIYRFSNLFGKWCRPNYNSVVATFCHNIANNLPIQINDPSTVLKLVYIDDVVDSLIDLLNADWNLNQKKYYEVKPEYSISLKELANLIYSLKKAG